MWMADDLVPISIEDVKEAAERCEAWRIYLHWSAGRYGQIWEDYHINIDEDGSLYCIGDLDFDEKKSHTWKRNTGSIGISLCCAYNAQANNGYDADYGDYPPTQAQIDMMAMVVATICKYGRINIDDALTHQEIATIDGYGPGSGDSETRWDLWFLPDSGERDKHGNMVMRSGGAVIRGKARFYLNYV